jgi:hypothetical protein
MDFFRYLDDRSFVDDDITGEASTWKQHYWED